MIGSPQLWQCAACRHQTSVTAGTILHRTKAPLTVWFWAAYLMTTDKRGLSALLLQRQLGLGNYETAWMMLHKFRRVMVNTNREPLRGEVEVDDTWIGGTQAGLRGSRQLKGRKAALVLVAVERRGQVTGRVRMEVIPDFKAATLLAFLKKHVSLGATLYTDGLKSYTDLETAGYRHVPRIQPSRTALRKGTKSVVPLADRAIGNLQQMSHWNLSWRKQGTTPGLPRRVCVPAQSTQAAAGSLSDSAWSWHGESARALQPNPRGSRHSTAVKPPQGVPQPIGAC